MQRVITVALIVDQVPVQLHADRLIDGLGKLLRDSSLWGLAKSKRRAARASRSQVLRLRYAAVGQLAGEAK